MPTQESNHLLQNSYTDILEMPGENQHVYDGISPIVVNNVNDTISLETSAMTKLEDSETTHVDSRIDDNGYTVYKINVDSEAGKSYTGVSPIVVNNDLNQISVNKLPFEIHRPLIGTVTQNSFKLECEYGVIHETSGQTTTNYDISRTDFYTHKVPNEDYNYTLLEARSEERTDPFLLGYTIPSFPSAGYAVMGTDKKWHDAGLFNVQNLNIMNQITIDNTQSSQSITFTVDDVNQIKGNLIVVGIPYSSTLSLGNGYIEIYEDGSLLDTKKFQIMCAPNALECEFFGGQFSSSVSTTKRNITIELKIYNASNRWSSGSRLVAKVDGFKIINYSEV